MADGKKDRVGIIGAGRMGLPMVKHMLRHGYSVTACDINAANLQQGARDAGASEVAETPTFVSAARRLFVILGVGYDEEVNEVVLGAQGSSCRACRRVQSSPSLRPLRLSTP